MGYLEPQDFDGTLGKPTASAIKEFQKANGMPETGAFTDELVKKVYAVAGKGEPPAGHLFVRQEFGRVFDAPVTFKDPETPLGTHLFTAMKFAPGDTSTRWMAISLQGDDAASRARPARDSERPSPEDFRAADARLFAHHRRHGDQFGDLAEGRRLPRVGQGHAGQDHHGERSTATIQAKPRKKKSRTVRRATAPSYSYNAPRRFYAGLSLLALVG